MFVLQLCRATRPEWSSCCTVGKDPFNRPSWWLARWVLGYCTWTPGIEEFTVHMNIECCGRALRMTPVELTSRPEESWLECTEINVDLRRLLASSRYRSHMHLLFLLTRILECNINVFCFFLDLSQTKAQTPEGCRCNGNGAKQCRIW